nr:interaptin-like isoform X1 [Leptinotarsa decemlineata]
MQLVLLIIKIMDHLGTSETSGVVDIQNAVLGETKQVLEIMEESKEKVSNLQEDLKQAEDSIEQLENSIRIRKNTKNDNLAIIESNETFRDDVKELNRKFLTSAQLIYSCGQEFFQEQSLYETQLDKREGMISEETYNSMVKEYEAREKNLSAELKKIDEQNLELKKNLRAKHQENENLNIELSNLIREEEFFKKQYLEKVHVLDQEKAMYSTEIESLSNIIALMDHDLCGMLRSIDDTIKRNANLEQSITERLDDTDKKIEGLQKEFFAKKKHFEDLTNLRNDMNTEIMKTESSVKLTEVQILQTDIEKKDIESKLMTLEQTSIGAIKAHEDFITSYEKRAADEKQVNFKISAELKALELKIETFDKEIQVMKNYSDDIEGLPETDLEKQHEQKQAIINEIKTTKQQLSEQLKIVKIEQQEKIKKEQDEITSMEKTIKQFETDISTTEEKINKLKADEELIITENLELEKKWIELEREIEKLKEAVRARNDDIFRVPDKILESTSVTPKIVPKIPPSKFRNWDSDTSIESEDRSFAERARQKIKKMKKKI